MLATFADPNAHPFSGMQKMGVHQMEGLIHLMLAELACQIALPRHSRQRPPADRVRVWALGQDQKLTQAGFGLNERDNSGWGSWVLCFSFP